jgi:hypothetical protein
LILWRSNYPLSKNCSLPNQPYSHGTNNTRSNCFLFIENFHQPILCLQVACKPEQCSISSTSLNNAQFQAKENIAKVARDESSDITCSGIPSGQNQLTTEVFLHRSNK